MKKNLLKLFLLAAVLIVGAGEMKAAGWYHLAGTVVAVCDEGASGYVSMGPRAVYGEVLADENIEWSSTNKTCTIATYSSTRYANIYYYAKPAPGSYFMGWYTDAACTNRVASDTNGDNKLIAVLRSSKLGSSPKAEASWPDQTKATYYAKFSTTPGPVFVGLEAISNQPTLGGVNPVEPTKVSVDPIDGMTYGNLSTSWTYGKSDCVIEYGAYEDLGEEIRQRIYVGVMAKRGCNFVKWNVETPENTVIAEEDGYSRFAYRTAVDIVTTKTAIAESQNTIVLGKISADFEEIGGTTLTLQKKAGLGEITGKYRYYAITLKPDGTPTVTDKYYDDTTWEDYVLESVDIATTERQYDDLYVFDGIEIKAIPQPGVAFRGWYQVNGGNKTLLSTNTTLTRRIGVTDTIYADFSSYTEDEKFLVNGNTYTNFAEALAVAPVSESKVILQLSDYTIPAGTYTIPAGVTLLVPHSGAQEEPSTSINRTSIEGNPIGAYCTLTLAEGAHLNVYGTIEVSGKQTVGSEDTGADVGISRTSGPTFGQMVMNVGSSITLNNGSEFRAWGFVTGTGAIDARRGAVVKEQFQVMDWKGLTNTTSMFHSPNDVYKILPVNQYYIQNIESPVTYRPGAKLLACAAVHLGVGIIAMNNVGIIGVDYGNGTKDEALFLMNNNDDSEDTWVRKSYLPATDQQLYEANNAASLGSLVMRISLPFVGTVTMDSREYKLPITNNFKIHLLSGEMHITQDTEILPGAEVEVNKKSTLIIDPGQTMWFWDSENWGKYVSARMNDTRTGYIFDYASSVKYRPGGTPAVRTLTPAGLGDAKLTVHGTVDVQGYLKTTEAGAAVTSTKEDAGTIMFSNAAPATDASDKVWQVTGLAPNPTYVGIPCSSALLTNEAGSNFGAYTATAGTVAGQSFCFIDINEDGKGEWVSLTDDDVNCMVYDQGGVYYIKPQAYVPISSGVPTEEADHTYRDHYAGTNKIYINTPDCQWWEVVPVEGHSDLFECQHPNNHTYYYYTGDHWAEKKFNVYWRNWNGELLKFTNVELELQDHYELSFGSHPQWLSDNPTREEDAQYSYKFAGWSPEITASTQITGDTTFVACYTETARQYFITFKNASGVELETTSYPYLAMPTPPEADLTTYQWSPAIGAVTGNQVYQLVAKPETFTVIYKNWDGTPLQTTSGITSGAATPNCATPSKASDALYSYSFDAWSPAPAATVTADAIYTATFTRNSRNYTIRFLGEGGSPVLSSTSLAYGATPTPPTGEGTTKASTDEKTYTLVWSPLVGTVVGNQDYTATFTEQTRQYTVTWKNYGGSTITTDYVDYGATPAYSGLTPTKETAEKIFTFTGWSPAITAVAGNQEYTAQFDEGHLKTVTVAVDGTSDISGHVETLILNASEESSGQLTGNITATNAYFDFAINATTALATGATRQWHSFGVPWQVNLDTDPIQEVGGANRTFVLGRDYDIIYYDGAKRASSGAGYWCWEYLEYHSHILQPGQGYMIAFIPSLGNIGKIRFVKKNMAPVIFNGTMTVDAHNSGVTTNSGWNAIANPKAYKATLNAGATTGYVYNPATNDYTPYNIEDKDYIVGKAVFIQAGASQSVVINNASGNSFVAAAPARRANATDKQYLSLNDYYQIAIASERVAGGHVYVLPEEEKENQYVIGHDLAQFGMSTAVPQVWVNRYDTKLALNTTALVGETAEFPMGVYAPAAGEYTIRLNAQPSEDYTVYLTRDGQVIWNLSDGAFVTTLTSGIQSNYGVRLVRKAPQVATGIDEAVVDAKNETRKVLIDNQVFIIREGHVYTVDGQIVK